MSQKLSYISVIIVFIVFNQLIYLSAKPVYYSEPDLTNPYIREELRESCGYRYGVTHHKIRYKNPCFPQPFADRSVSVNLRAINTTVDWPKSRVLGGRDVKLREAPWVVQIVKLEYSLIFHQLISIEHWCTGSLITMRYILTAAHCWDEKLNYAVFAGRDETAEGWRTDQMTWYPHQDWTDGSLDANGKPIVNQRYDIAIIKLKEPINWKNEGKDEKGMYLINTICLPLLEDFTRPIFHLPDALIYRKATLFGWGGLGVSANGLDKDARILQRGDFLVNYYSIYGGIMFLSEENSPQRTCGGDSGSGYVQYLDDFEHRAVLIAVHSGSLPKTNVTDYPPCDYEHMGRQIGVRVAEHLEWIYQYLEQN